MSCVFGTARQSFPCTSVSSLAFVWHLVPWHSSLVGVTTWIRYVKCVDRAGGHRCAGSENLRVGAACAVLYGAVVAFWTGADVARGPGSGGDVPRAYRTASRGACRSSCSCGPFSCTGAGSVQAGPMQAMTPSRARVGSGPSCVTRRCTLYLPAVAFACVSHRLLRSSMQV